MRRYTHPEAAAIAPVFFPPFFPVVPAPLPLRPLAGAAPPPCGTRPSSAAMRRRRLRRLEMLMALTAPPAVGTVSMEGMCGRGFELWFGLTEGCGDGFTVGVDVFDGEDCEHEAGVVFGGPVD